MFRNLLLLISKHAGRLETRCEYAICAMSQLICLDAFNDLNCVRVYGRLRTFTVEDIRGNVHGPVRLHFCIAQ